MDTDDAADSATNYHATIDAMRRDLMLAHNVWTSQCRRMDEEKIKPEDMSDDRKIAYAASAMASTYSYTLAATLGIAQRMAPLDFAKHLAFEADEILTNGDFDDHNGDLREAEDEKEGQ